MIKVLLLITGGAIGTVFRYGVSTWVQRSEERRVGKEC